MTLPNEIQKSYEVSGVKTLDFDADPLYGRAPMYVDFYNIEIILGDDRITKVYPSVPHTDTINKTY